MNNNIQNTSQNISRMGADSMVEHQMRVMKKKKQRKRLKTLLLSMWIAAAVCVVMLVVAIATNETIMSMLFPTESHDVDVQKLYNIDGRVERVPLDEVEDYIASGEWTRRLVTLYHPDKGTDSITVREEDVEATMRQDNHWREDDDFVYLVDTKNRIYHIVKRDQADQYVQFFPDTSRIEDYRSGLSGYVYKEELS